MMDLPWQIVQLAETGHPGQYKLWALIGNDLHAIKLNVPRVFYVNQKTAKEGEGAMWKKVNKVLPRSHPVYFLYEYCVPEDVYIEHMNEINADLSSPDIEGVYETQVPLLFRVLLNLGCVCTVSREFVRALGGRETDTFDLDHLQFRTLAQYPYLEVGGIKHVYLYHHMSGQKQMFGLFFPMNKRATIFVVDTVRTNQMPNMGPLFNGEHASKVAQGSDPDVLPDPSHTFEVRIEKDIKLVYRSIQRLLTVYKDERRGPTFIAVQSPLDFQHLASIMPGLMDFPMVPVHVSDDESLYSVLDWQRVGSRRMLQHYLNVSLILQAMLEQCRYFHVPLGNLPKDTTLFGCDLFFARHLRKHNHLLWVSPTDRPDLGGKEADDNRANTEADESGNVEIGTGGCYSSVCLELDMASLAVNTLVQSAHVNDHEGASAVSFDLMPQTSLEDMVSGQGAATMLASYDETALCSTAFRILKSMVQGWIRDVTQYQNVFADYQIIHMYRWLRSPSAFLYDPALRRTLHNLMKKLFMQLMSEFKRLGSTIVYANFNRLVICTKKRRLEDALAYVEYITNSIRSKELYHMIDFSYVQCWQLLLWMDPANHGGVRGKLPSEMVNQDPTMLQGSQKTPRKEKEGEESGGESEEEEEEQRAETPVNEVLNQSDDEGDGSPDIEMNWNMAKFLPEAGACQVNFNMIVAGYILALCQHLMAEQRRLTPGNTPIQRKSNTQTQTLYDGHATPSTVDYCQKLIQGEMTMQLFGITQKIQKKISGTSGDKERLSEEFPVLPGSHLPLSNPALEFVKSVCQVLSLDTNVSLQVNKMKRDLLKLISVGEFSEDAEFKDPCLSYILPEVICKTCNHTRDLDLCRDPYLPNDTGRVAVWSCIQCHTEYDLEEIEQMLIQILQRKSMAFVLQDLKCVKCKQVKMENLSKHCTCAGEFKVTMSIKDLQQTMKTFANIARHYSMTLLLSVVEWSLAMNNAL